MTLPFGSGRLVVASPEAFKMESGEKLYVVCTYPKVGCD
jgi:ATP phosphoribosyltransferase